MKKSQRGVGIDQMKKKEGANTQSFKNLNVVFFYQWSIDVKSAVRFQK